MGELFRRIRYLLQRRRYDAELAGDMEFHREMAARAGRNNFGNSLRMQEQAREAWGWTWFDRLVQDVRYASRLLVRSPGFTLMAVLVLAIGIGVNVAAFSLFNMMALKLLPVRDPATLVRLERRSPEAYSSEMQYPMFAFYRDHARTLSAAMGVLGVPPMQFEEDVQPASATFVTANYFTELGTPAAFGRLFDPHIDSDPAAAPAAVLSYGFWQRRYAGDPAVVGRVIHLNKKPATIIGITPYAAAALDNQHPDLWMPVAQQPYFVDGSNVLTSWNDSSTRMWGRLAPGVTAGAAERELRSLADEIRRQHPEAVWDREGIQSSPGGHMQVLHPEELQVAAMVGVLTLLILAVACANLGGLMLANAVAREHEIGIRISIGAGRARIFRQLCTESLLLAALGSLAGLGLGCAVVKAFLSRSDAPKWFSATPDWRVLLFTTGATLVAALIFGLAPALQIARQRQRKTLARQILVGAQVAASCVLLIVTALLIRATQHALYTDPGFGYEQLLTIDAQLGTHGYKPASARVYLDQMRARLSALPGVRSVSLVKLPPLGHTVSRERRQIDGRIVTMYPNWVAPDFFHAMGIPLLMGRTFLPNEKNVIVISESLARRQWPGQSPIGKSMEGNATETIVGVVGDAHINAVSDDDAVEQYWPSQPDDMPGMVLVARVSGEPGAVSPAIKGISESIDPKLFPEIRQLKLLYRDNVAGVERIATAVSLMGFVAATLAAVGIIGLVAYTVRQRTKEIAIRLALGAKPAHVLSAVLRQFSLPILLGLAAGSAVAAMSSRVLRQALFGVSNLDPASYAGAIALLAMIVLISMLVPARRAIKLDLAKTLRCD